MSSRSTIIYTSGSHIFSDSNEHIYEDGKWIGYKIYGGIDLRETESITESETEVTIKLKGELADVLGDTLILKRSEVPEIEIDNYDIGFGEIHPHSDIAKWFYAKAKRNDT